jgi:Yip1 domain
MTFALSASRSESVRLMLSRMVGAARLKGSIFRSLREDPDATGQSLLVLAIAGLSFGLGFTFSLSGDLSGTLLGGVFGVATSIVFGFVWLTVTYIVGTRLLRGSASYWGLARPLFFSASPGVVFLITLVPNLAVQEIFRAVGIGWIAIASVSAIKNVFGFDSPRAFTTFVVVALILLVGYGFVASI